MIPEILVLAVFGTFIFAGYAHSSHKLNAWTLNSTEVQSRLRGLNIVIFDRTI